MSIQIKNVSVNDLKPYENNPRFNDDAVEYVKNSIKEFGFKNPIIIDKSNVIVAGHTRLKAAIELGIQLVPCIIADDLNEEQIKAFRLADNKISELATWDFEKLNLELDGLDIDMQSFGFFDIDLTDQELEKQMEYLTEEKEKKEKYTIKLVFDTFEEAEKCKEDLRSLGYAGGGRNSMKIFLAGIGYIFNSPEIIYKYKPAYVLQSFWYLRNFSQREELMKYYLSDDCKMFLLDSGAFTFMNSNKNEDIKAYLDSYIEFINKYDIKYFFELDLYTIIGIEETYKMTKYLEIKTGKKSIPVFHKCLGLKRFREMCQNYNYVAIGASGLTQECKWVNDPRLLNKMIEIAHSYGTKIHGLGYTRMSNLNDTKVKFDTVDSSSVTSGSRFGTVYYLKNGRIYSKSVKKKGQRIKNLAIIDSYNMGVWCTFQKIKGGIYEK